MEKATIKLRIAHCTILGNQEKFGRKEYNRMKERMVDYNRNYA